MRHRRSAHSDCIALLPDIWQLDTNYIGRSAHSDCIALLRAAKALAKGKIAVAVPTRTA